MKHCFVNNVRPANNLRLCCMVRVYASLLDTVRELNISVNLLLDRDSQCVVHRQPSRDRIQLCDIRRCVHHQQWTDCRGFDHYSDCILQASSSFPGKLKYFVGWRLKNKNNCIIDVKFGIHKEYYLVLTLRLRWPKWLHETRTVIHTPHITFLHATS